MHVNWRFDMDTRFEFERDGCLLLRQVVPDRLLNPLIEHISRAIGQYADGLYAKGELADTYADLPFETRLVALNRGAEARLRSWNNIAVCEGLYNLICYPAIVDVLRPILGHDFGFNGDYHLRPKLPNSTYTAFPWHQDSQYYGVESQHARIVTVWIPLVDVDEENGCLQVMPGSFKWGLLRGARGSDQNMRTFEDVDSKGEPELLPMRKGDIFLFSNLTFHKSTVNLTDSVRWSIDIRYARIPKCHRLSREVRESEDFMRTKLRNTGRVPIALDGATPRLSYNEWHRELDQSRSDLTRSRSAD